MATVPATMLPCLRSSTDAPAAGILAPALPAPLPPTTPLAVAPGWGVATLATRDSINVENQSSLHAAVPANAHEDNMTKQPASTATQEDCRLSAAGGAARQHAAMDLPPEGRSQNGFEGEACNTLAGPNLQRSAAASESAAPTALRVMPPAGGLGSMALLAHSILPQQLQLLQLHHLLRQQHLQLLAAAQQQQQKQLQQKHLQQQQQQQLQQQHVPGMHGAGEAGANSNNSQRAADGCELQRIRTGTGPESCVAPEKTAATAADRRERLLRDPVAIPNEGSCGKTVLKTEEASGVGRTCSQRERGGIPNRQQLDDVSDDRGVRQEDVKSSAPHTDQNGGDVKKADEDGQVHEGVGNEEQPEEHMPGCHRCHFATSGCVRCRAQPLARRPYARWRPEEGRYQEGIPRAPVFHPSPEEFTDPLSYIVKIRPEAEKFGVCCIVPPPSCWDPPFALAPCLETATAADDDYNPNRAEFLFQPTKQITSHLVMRPCNCDPAATRKGTGSGHPCACAQSSELTQPPPRPHQQAPSGDPTDRLLSSRSENLSGSNNSACQTQQVYSQRYPHLQEGQQGLTVSVPVASMAGVTDVATAVAVTELAGCMVSAVKPTPSEGHTARGAPMIGAAAGTATATSLGTMASTSGVRVPLVAPGCCLQPRPPGAAVEGSLERYFAGLGAHPLLGVDEASAMAAASALSSAAGSSQGRVRLTASERTHSGVESGSGDAASDGDGCGSQEPSGLGRRKEAPGGGGNGTCGAADTSREECRGTEDSGGVISGSVSGDADNHDSTSAKGWHTLRSFQAYCQWARSLHFSTPEFVDRCGQPPLGDRSRPTGHTTQQLASTSTNTASTELSRQPPPCVHAAMVHGAAGCEPSTAEVEAEFWRIAERPTLGATVEMLYGSDLDSCRTGSGFPLPPWGPPPSDPWAARLHAAPVDQRCRAYACHPWNINNLPRAPGSLLQYLQTDAPMPGIMAPRQTLGSCFSASCWRVEEHSLYSIHYIHTGAEKVWYSAPAHANEQFEAAMRDALPQQFAEDPLFLYRQCTHMSPSELRRRGVPVFRLVQKAGSFVVIFPSAYTAGINTGFSVSEAVNFATPDWLPFGSAAARKYARQGKRPTISHDSLLIRLVSAAPAVHAAQQGALALQCLQPVAPVAQALVAAAAQEATEHLSPCQEVESGSPGLMLPDVAPQAETRQSGTHIKNEVQQVEDVTPGSGSGQLAATGTSGGCMASNAAVKDFRGTTELAARGDGCLPPYSWQVGMGLSAEVPAAAVCVAAGELAVRLEDEAQRRAVARETGVVQVVEVKEGHSMSNLSDAQGPAIMQTWPPDASCVLCRADLYLSAIVSSQRPDVAACPLHAAALGVPPESCTLLLRWSLEELRELLNTARELFPEAHEAVTTARHRLAATPLTAIRRCGPISTDGVPFAAPPCKSECTVGRDLSAADSLPYIPYDAGAASSSASTVVATAQETVATAMPLKVEWSMTPRPQLAAAESGKHATAASTAATAAERSRQAPLSEEDLAQAERKEGLQRVQEVTKRPRTQREARRRAGNTSHAVLGSGPVEPVVPAVPTASPTEPPALVNTASMQGETPAAVQQVESVAACTSGNDRPASPPDSMTAACAMTGTLAAGTVASADSAAEGPLAVVVGSGKVLEAANAIWEDPSDRDAPVQGLKRSIHGVASQPVETDRSVRPRRVRRVPRHLLDTVLELAEEMRQVVADVATPPPPPSPPSLGTSVPDAAVVVEGDPAGEADTVLLEPPPLQQPSMFEAASQQHVVEEVPKQRVSSAGADGLTGMAGTITKTEMLVGEDLSELKARQETDHQTVSACQQQQQLLTGMSQEPTLSQNQQQQQHTSSAGQEFPQCQHQQPPHDTVQQPVSGAPAPQQPSAEDLGISPRRSSRATRPSVRLLDAVAAAGSATAFYASTVAAAVSPAPAVLLLKRETTSGPSTSIRAGTVVSRRAPLVIGAAAAGAAGLPPSLPFAVPTAASGTAKASPSSAQEQTRSPGTTAACSEGVEGEEEIEAEEVTDGGSSSVVAASAAAETGALQRKLHYDDGEIETVLLLEGPVTDEVLNRASSTPTADAVLVSLPIHQDLSVTNPSPMTDRLAADVAAQPLVQPQRPSSLLPLPASSPQPATSAPVSALGRPVRKRRTTLNDDMVIYGESAALFGGRAAGTAASGGKRKLNSDRLPAAPVGEAAAVGESRDATYRQTAHDMADDVSPLVDEHDALASFAAEEEELRSRMMSPGLFADLHGSRSPSPPPMRLLLSGMGTFLYTSTGSMDAEADAAAIVRCAGPVSPAQGAVADVSMQLDCVMVHLTQLPELIDLHDAGPDDDDPDSFMLDEPDRPLILSPAPSSTGGLDTQGALPQSGAVSPGAAGAVNGGLVQVCSANQGQGYRGPSGSAGGGGSVVTAVQELQPILMVGSLPSLAADLPPMGSDQSQQWGVSPLPRDSCAPQALLAEGCGVIGGRSGCGDPLWDASRGCITGATDSAFPCLQPPLDAAGSRHVAPTPAGSAVGGLGAGQLGGSRSALSSLAASTGGEWADLDDLIAL